MVSAAAELVALERRGFGFEALGGGDQLRELLGAEERTTYQPSPPSVSRRLE